MLGFIQSKQVINQSIGASGAAAFDLDVSGYSHQARSRVAVMSGAHSGLDISALTSNSRHQER